MWSGWHCRWWILVYRRLRKDLALCLCIETTFCWSRLWLSKRLLSLQGQVSLPRCHCDDIWWSCGMPLCSSLLISDYTYSTSSSPLPRNPVLKGAPLWCPLRAQIFMPFWLCGLENLVEVHYFFGNYSFNLSFNDPFSQRGCVDWPSNAEANASDWQ